MHDLEYFIHLDITHLLFELNTMHTTCFPKDVASVPKHRVRVGHKIQLRTVLTVGTKASRWVKWLYSSVGWGLLKALLTSPPWTHIPNLQGLVSRAGVELKHGRHKKQVQHGATTRNETNTECYWMSICAWSPPGLSDEALHLTGMQSLKSIRKKSGEGERI